MRPARPPRGRGADHQPRRPGHRGGRPPRRRLGGQGAERLASPVLDAGLPGAAGPAGLKSLVTPTGGSYVIISGPQYASALAPLVDWKTRKGWPVVVVTTDETGTTNAGIQAWLTERLRHLGDAARVRAAGGRRRYRPGLELLRQRHRPALRPARRRRLAARRHARPLLGLQPERVRGHGGQDRGLRADALPGPAPTGSPAA